MARLDSPRPPRGSVSIESEVYCYSPLFRVDEEPSEALLCELTGLRHSFSLVGGLKHGLRNAFLP